MSSKLNYKLKTTTSALAIGIALTSPNAYGMEAQDAQPTEGWGSWVTTGIYNTGAGVFNGVCNTPGALYNAGAGVVNGLCDGSAVVFNGVREGSAAVASEARIATKVGRVGFEEGVVEYMPIVLHNLCMHAGQKLSVEDLGNFLKILDMRTLQSEGLNNFLQNLCLTLNPANFSFDSYDVRSNIRMILKKGGNLICRADKEIKNADKGKNPVDTPKINYQPTCMGQLFVENHVCDKIDDFLKASSFFSSPKTIDDLENSELYRVAGKLLAKDMFTGLIRHICLGNSEDAEYYVTHKLTSRSEDRLKFIAGVHSAFVDVSEVAIHNAVYAAIRKMGSEGVDFLAPGTLKKITGAATGVVIGKLSGLILPESLWEGLKSSRLADIAFSKTTGASLNMQIHEQEAVKNKITKNSYISQAGSGIAVYALEESKLAQKIDSLVAEQLGNLKGMLFKDSDLVSGSDSVLPFDKDESYENGRAYLLKHCYDISEAYKNEMPPLCIKSVDGVFTPPPKDYSGIQKFRVDHPIVSQKIAPLTTLGTAVAIGYNWGPTIVKGGINGGVNCVVGSLVVDPVLKFIANPILKPIEEGIEKLINPIDNGIEKLTGYNINSRKIIPASIRPIASVALTYGLSCAVPIAFPYVCAAGGAYITYTGVKDLYKYCSGQPSSIGTVKQAVKTVTQVRHLTNTGCELVGELGGLTAEIKKSVHNLSSIYDLIIGDDIEAFKNSENQGSLLQIVTTGFSLVDAYGQVQNVLNEARDTYDIGTELILKIQDK